MGAVRGRGCCCCWRQMLRLGCWQSSRHVPVPLAVASRVKGLLTALGFLSAVMRFPGCGCWRRRRRCRRCRGTNRARLGHGRGPLRGRGRAQAQAGCWGSLHQIPTLHHTTLAGAAGAAAGGSRGVKGWRETQALKVHVLLQQPVHRGSCSWRKVWNHHAKRLAVGCCCCCCCCCYW